MLARSGEEEKIVKKKEKNQKKLIHDVVIEWSGPGMDMGLEMSI